MKNNIITNKNEIIDLLGEYGQLSNVFSDKFGIINAVMERKELEEYGLYMFQSLSADIRALCGAAKDISSGGLGIDFDRKTALCSCFGEALERYAMSFVKEKEIVKCHMAELPNEFVDDRFALYDQDVYESSIRHFLHPRKDVLSWVKISSVKHENKKIFWPAGMVYLPYDEVVTETTSTGLAAANDITNAVNSGIMEIIERDAIALYFYFKIKMDEVLIESIKGENAKFIKRIQEKYNVKIYKLMTDIGVPVYYSLIWTGRGKKTHFGIGASASLNTDMALIKSLKECLFTYFYSKNIMDLKKDDANSINALYEHFLYYQGMNFEMLLNCGKKVEYNSQEVKIDEVIKKINENGYDIYYIDLTTTDVASAGINVVRVIIPGYIDVNKTHLLPFKESNRYNEFSKRMGLNDKKLDFSQPHPFP